MRVLVADASASPDALLEKIDAEAPARVDIGAAQLKAILLELARLSRQLEERQLVERAKGLFMKSRGLDEKSAHAALRKMAMDRQLRLGEVAQRMLDAADLLGTEPNSGSGS